MIARLSPRCLRRDVRGASLAEFAILLPVVLIATMGASEAMYQAYLQAMIEGQLQQYGRKSTLQGGLENSTTYNSAIEAAIKRLNKSATVTFTRLNYATFLAIAPERFDDNNNNLRRDPGECFDDINKNGTWDLNPGMSGQGSANDVTAYKIVVNYARLFPVEQWIGWGSDATLTFTTYLKNQPFASQSARTVTKICT